MPDRTIKAKKLAKYLLQANYDCEARGVSISDLMGVVRELPSEWKDALANGKGKRAVIDEMVAEVSERLFESSETTAVAEPLELPSAGLPVSVVAGLTRMVDQYGGAKIADCVGDIRNC